MAIIKNYKTKITFDLESKPKNDINNPNFSTPIQVRGANDVDGFLRNAEKYRHFAAWAKWNPDLFFDLIRPKTGGVALHLDQRVFLRSVARFISTYGVFPRGWSKTFLEVLAMYHTAIWFPDVELSMSAQTQANAVKLLKAKHRDILKKYPILEQEIKDANFTKDDGRVEFVSGAVIDILANAQTSKGQRRHRLNIEESNLLNDRLYEDALEPIPNNPRYTIGKLAIVNPEELNGQINFFTTSGFRGSSEFDRNIKMLDEMAELKGKIVLGADWQLACKMGRGETKSRILNKKKNLSPISFAQNYESKWVGVTDGALVDIRKLLEARSLIYSEFNGDGKSDYIISMDIARSNRLSGNQSSIVVFKIIRDGNGGISNIDMVYLYNIPNGLNFESQAIELKRLAKRYNPKAIILDINGVGKGVLEECLKEQIDPKSGEILECWDTINTDDIPKITGSRKIVFGIESQGKNTDMEKLYFLIVLLLVMLLMFILKLLILMVFLQKC